MSTEQSNISALCIGRHPILSEHFARYFAALGFETRPATGFADAITSASAAPPDLLICDYELLATHSLECLEKDELLCRTAVIGVSLTRRPAEAHLLDVNNIAGFFYLPTLDRVMARRVLHAAALSSRAGYTPAPVTTSPANDLSPLHLEAPGMS